MKTKQMVNFEKALEEKKQQQKRCVRENGYSSSVLTLLIAYFEKRIKKA